MTQQDHLGEAMTRKLGALPSEAIRVLIQIVAQYLHALILFRQIADGLPLSRPAPPSCRPCPAAIQSISQGAITYQLRRLRLHAFIERLPNSFRYRVTELGLRAALFFTRAYNRILRPGLAATLPGPHTINVPLKRAFDRIDTQITQWINQAQLAA